MAYGYLSLFTVLGLGYSGVNWAVNENEHYLGIAAADGSLEKWMWNWTTFILTTYVLTFAGVVYGTGLTKDQEQRLAVFVMYQCCSMSMVLMCVGGNHLPHGMLIPKEFYAATACQYFFLFFGAATMKAGLPAMPLRSMAKPTSLQSAMVGLNMFFGLFWLLDIMSISGPLKYLVAGTEISAAANCAGKFFGAFIFGHTMLLGFCYTYLTEKQLKTFCAISAVLQVGGQVFAMMPMIDALFASDAAFQSHVIRVIQIATYVAGAAAGTKDAPAKKSA